MNDKDGETKILRFYLYEFEDGERVEKPIAEIEIPHEVIGDTTFYVENEHVIIDAVSAYSELDTVLTGTDGYPSKGFGYEVYDSEGNIYFQLIEIERKEDGEQ